MIAQTRPPRPAHTTEDLLERARLVTGMKIREITDVTDDEAGLIVTTHDGNAVIVVPVDRPDALGQTGVLYYPTADVNRPPKGRKVFVRPGTPVVSITTGGDAWSVKDFKVAAGQLIIPAKIGGPGGASWRPWVGTDPVRAFACWLYLANGHEGSLRNATIYSPEAAEYRRIVLKSGWLSEHEAEGL